MRRKEGASSPLPLVYRGDFFPSLLWGLLVLLLEALVSCTLVQEDLPAEDVALVHLTVVVVILLQCDSAVTWERVRIDGEDQMGLSKTEDRMDVRFGSDHPLIDHVEDSEMALVLLVLVHSFSIPVAGTKDCDINIASHQRPVHL